MFVEIGALLKSVAHGLLFCSECVPGGCPCVRPGGDPGLPTGFQVFSLRTFFLGGQSAATLGGILSVKEETKKVN